MQPHNKGRGYEVGENQFLLVQDNELEAAEQKGRSRPHSRTPAKSAIEQNDEREPANVQAPEPLFRPTKSIPRGQEP